MVRQPALTDTTLVSHETGVFSSPHYDHSVAVMIPPPTTSSPL